MRPKRTVMEVPSTSTSQNFDEVFSRNSKRRIPRVYRRYPVARNSGGFVRLFAHFFSATRFTVHELLPVVKLIFCWTDTAYSVSPSSTLPSVIVYLRRPSTAGS